MIVVGILEGGEKEVRIRVGVEEDMVLEVVGRRMDPLEEDIDQEGDTPLARMVVEEDIPVEEGIRMGFVLPEGDHILNTLGEAALHIVPAEEDNREEVPDSTT